jgi:hypothetical protein
MDGATMASSLPAESICARSGRPDRSELARQIFAASVAITGVASEIADVSL